MASLLASGFSAQQSLIMAGQKSSAGFQHSLKQMWGVMATGEPLGKVLAQHPRYFDRWTVNLVQMAEHSGALVTVFEKLALSTERHQRHQRLYRAIGFSLALTTLSCICLLVALLQASWLRQIGFWGGMLLLAGLLGFGSQLISRVPWHRSLYRSYLSLPVIGSILTARSVLLLTELEVPLACGVPLLTAVDMLRTHLPDPDLKATLTIALQQIHKGQPLSQSLSGRLPNIAVQMVRTGEEAGDLPTMLGKLASYYEDEAETLLKQVNAILKPITLLAMGGFVLILGWQLLQLLFSNLSN